MKLTIARLRRLIREALMFEEADVPGRWRAEDGEPVDIDDEDRLGYGGFASPLDEDELEEGKKKNTLWGNIQARRKAGKPRLKPGQKGYPKTLDVESQVKQGHEDASQISQMNRQGDGDRYDQMGNKKK